MVTLGGLKFHAIGGYMEYEQQANSRMLSMVYVLHKDIAAEQAYFISKNSKNSGFVAQHTWRNMSGTIDVDSPENGWVVLLIAYEPMRYSLERLASSVLLEPSMARISPAAETATAFFSSEMGASVCTGGFPDTFAGR